jgi:hypothetical protein
MWHQLLHRFDAAAHLPLVTTDEEGCRHTVANLTGIAVDGAAVCCQTLALGAVCRRRNGAWHIPFVGVARHDPQHPALTRGADEHRNPWSLHGFGAWIGTFELIIAAGKLRRFVPKQTRDHFKTLLEPVHALSQWWERQAKGTVFLVVPASPQAQD